MYTPYVFSRRCISLFWLNPLILSELNLFMNIIGREDRWTLKLSPTPQWNSNLYQCHISLNARMVNSLLLYWYVYYKTVTWTVLITTAEVCLGHCPMVLRASICKLDRRLSYSDHSFLCMNGSQGFEDVLGHWCGVMFWSWVVELD